MAVGGAFLGGGVELVPAGYCKLSLQIMTDDRAGLNGTFTISGGGNTYTATAGTDGRAEKEVPSGVTYTVSVSVSGYNSTAQLVVAESATIKYVRFDIVKTSYGTDTKPVKIVNGTPTPVANDLAVDSSVVHIAGSETITGAKTFSSTITVSSSGTITSGNTGAVSGGVVYTALTNGTVSKVGSVNVGSDTQPIKLVAGVPTQVANELALKSALTDGSVTKVGTANVGGTLQIVYLSSGVPTAGTQLYSKNININGTNYAVIRSANSNIGTIYAPTAVGTAGQVLRSSGSGAPAWESVGSVASGNTGLVTGGAVYSALPTVNNGTLTIKRNGTQVTTFSANQSGNATADISVPTKVSQITNDSGFITSSGSCNYATSAGYVSLPYINCTTVAQSSVGNSDVGLTWNSITKMPNNDSVYKYNNGIVTIKQSGHYLVNAQIYGQCSSASRVEISVWRNGVVSYLADNYVAVTGRNVTVSVSGIFAMAADEYIQIKSWCESGTFTLTNNYGACAFEILRVQ